MSGAVDTAFGWKCQAKSGYLGVADAGSAVAFKRYLLLPMEGMTEAQALTGIGEPADGANALIYLAEGDYINAGTSGAAMVPFLGWGAVGSKYLGKAGDILHGAEFAGGGGKEILKSVTSFTPFNSVDDLISGAGKLENGKSAKQGFVHNQDAETVLMDLSEKLNAPLQNGRNGEVFIQSGNYRVGYHTSTSPGQIPTLYINDGSSKQIKLRFPDSY